MTFTHLHLHSQYSFLDGSIRINDLVFRLLQLKMKSIALTDTGNMFGILDFYTSMIKYGLKPIIGMEIYILDSHMLQKKKPNKYSLVLIAKNNLGLHNLKLLSTKAFFDGKLYYPQVNKQTLFRHKEGLIVLSSGICGEIGQSVLQNNLKDAATIMCNYKDIFGYNNFFFRIASA